MPRTRFLLSIYPFHWVIWPWIEHTLGTYRGWRLCIGPFVVERRWE